MDRAKKDELPKMQGLILLEINFQIQVSFSFLVGFIDSICLPLYKVNKIKKQEKFFFYLFRRCLPKLIPV